MAVKKKLWVIFAIVFVTSLAVLSYYAYYNWKVSKQLVLDKQQTHIELVGNSVRAFVEAQGTLLNVLGVHLIAQHHLPDEPIHDALLDDTMKTYDALLGLGLVAYDGRALVTSSNFDLSKLPNLLDLKQTQDSFRTARESRKIQTGSTYVINALETKTYAMPIRKAIYIPEDAPQAIAVMTAGIRLDNTPIFGKRDSDLERINVDIIRGDRYPVFSSGDSAEYAKPIDHEFYTALKNHTIENQKFSHFHFPNSLSGENYQVVAYYDEFLDFWFVSKVDDQRISERFLNRVALAFPIFFIYNLMLFLFIHSMSKSEKKKKLELLEQAHHDMLTGLPNRTLFLNTLNQSVTSRRKGEHYNAVLFLDLDDFKAINDTHGHQYGDMLLKEAAKRVKLNIRPGDTLSRFGGDEFVVLLSSLGRTLVGAKSQAEQVALKILSALSSKYELEEYRYTNSVSIGMVLYNDGSLDGTELLKQADIAMYEAKHKGKNRVSLFDPQMQTEVASLFQLENELRIAVREKQFELFYQPQVDKNKRVLGAEALLRWHHPERGLIGPYNFISVAERVGLIVPIGEWVIEEACQQLSQWQQHDELKQLTLSVNVSYKQLKEPGFVQLVEDLTNKCEINKERLCLELTESVFVDNMSSSIAIMNELRDLGIHFSLDDFGTGYSSLRYLKQLPLKHLKIDKSFVDDLDNDKSDQSIVRAIILMSEALGLQTIAEGVETEGQQDYLRAEGCLFYQGYLFSKPLPITCFEYFVSTQE
ncbi:putative bifunctional diguanylate cyclase/phosphodiesterase [Vibrio amylolyticus]|uniref:putative bifunctional diguanylate cyclase/phosphodiesterase n=1 Tax=Vibrio amylolyticus TaxID=2847292 RepID=UPI003552FCAB